MQNSIKPMPVSQAILSERQNLEQIFPDMTISQFNKMIDVISKIAVKVLGVDKTVTATVERPPQPKTNFTIPPQNQAFSDDELIKLYEFARNIGVNRVIYPFQWSAKESAYGRNAAILVRADGFSLDGKIDYNNAPQPIHRETTIDELLVNPTGHPYCARIRDLEWLEKNLQQAPKAVVKQIPRFEKCDSKQQQFLANIYSLLSNDEVKLSIIRDKAIQTWPQYSAKSFKAFDSAIKTHLEPNGFVVCGGKGKNRTVKRLP